MEVSKNKFKRFYEEEAKFKKFLPSEDLLEEVRARLALSIIPKNINSVLDVGCGDGYLCSILADRIKKVSGVDISEIRIRRAKKKFKKTDLKVGDIIDLPYENNFFTLVLAGEVLEHIPNLKKALKEMKRVSKEYIAFTVPYKQKPTKVVCIHCLRKFYLDGHLHYFDENVIRKISEEFNLKILKIKKISAFPYTKFKSQPQFIKNLLNWLAVKVTSTYVGVLLKKN